MNYSGHNVTPLSTFILEETTGTLTTVRKLSSNFIGS
jgi:hypothetical protein